MKISDEMVEAGWAKVVGDDIAHVTDQASFCRLDLADAIAAVAPLILEEAAMIADEIGHGSNVDQGRRTAAAIRALSPTSHTSPEE